MTKNSQIFERYHDKKVEKGSETNVQNEYLVSVSLNDCSLKFKYSVNCCIYLHVECGSHFGQHTNRLSVDAVVHIDVLTACLDLYFQDETVNQRDHPPCVKG